MDGGGRKRKPPNPEGYGEESKELWRAREKTFQERQLIEKAQLHFREGRPTLFDLLLINTIPTAGFFNERSPLDLLQAVEDQVELESILSTVEDILEFREEGAVPSPSAGAPDSSGVSEYWDSLKAWLKPRVDKLGKPKLVEQSISNEQVIEEIRTLLGGKDYEALCKLELLVRNKLRLPEVDAEYWSCMLSELRGFKLATRLEDCHQRLLKLRKQEGSDDVSDFIRKRSSNEDPLGEKAAQSPAKDHWDDSREAVEWYESMKTISFYRNERLFDEEAVGLASPQYPWSAQQPPVKPRYYNWVYLRIEWTKYNQAHYNSENPPPSTPQGYCFNIFYPRLVDPTQPPTYTTEPDPIDADNWQLVRFIGGAPYEDLVFRIPAHRWELGHRAGFKCAFERSTLVLKFRFRKMLYRR